MANPDIPAAEVVLLAHLVAADAALSNPCLDVARGLPTGAAQLRYYWGGEVDPPGIPPRVLKAELLGQRFVIVRTWAAADLSPGTVAAIDAEMQSTAGQIRTRINGDSQLGGNVTDLRLEFAEPDILTITGTRCIVLKWFLDLSYVEYAVAP